jgi:gliding motility-associated-like protein
VTNPSTTESLREVHIEAFADGDLSYYMPAIALSPALAPGASRTITTPIFTSGVPDLGNRFCFAVHGFSTPVFDPVLVNCDTLCIDIPACACHTCDTCCTIDNIILRTGLSPNGDGFNDVYKIETGGKDCGIIEMTVFNRWGNIVWKSDDYQQNWGGTNQEGTVLLPEGTYFIVATVKDTGVVKTNFVDIRIE